MVENSEVLSCILKDLGHRYRNKEVFRQSDGTCGEAMAEMNMTPC